MAPKTSLPPNCNFIGCLLILFTSFLHLSSVLVVGGEETLHLTTVTWPFQSLIVGLTARIQCSLHRCSPQSAGSQEVEDPIVMWFKDDVLLFNNSEFEPTSGLEPANIVLQRSLKSDRGRGNGMEGASENQKCVVEELTLLLKNLSKKEAGEYRCQVRPPAGSSQPPQQLDFRLDILDSGLKAGFHENFTYDHTECCVERGLAPLCRAMCRPRTMHMEFFDPTSCKNEDYRGFLSCATDNGRLDYTPCCRQRNIPAFCFDFCSNRFDMLKKSHRLCLYYLPEIFTCFNRGTLPGTGGGGGGAAAESAPQVPNHLRVAIGKASGRKGSARRGGGKSGDHNKFCFNAGGRGSSASKASYTIHVKELPSIGTVGGGAEASGASAAVQSNRLHTKDESVLPFLLSRNNEANISGGGMGPLSNSRRRSKRDSPSSSSFHLGEIFVALHEASSATSATDTKFTKVDSAKLERGREGEGEDGGTELCFTWAVLGLHSNSRYVLYVQASNDFGTSEPSQPLFLSTAATETPPAPVPSQ